MLDLVRLGYEIERAGSSILKEVGLIVWLYDEHPLQDCEGCEGMVSSVESHSVYIVD